MAFPAVMPCTSSICRFIVPLDDGEILVSALNHEPVNRIRRYCSTNFTTKFAYCRHRVNCNSQSAHPHCPLPAKDHRSLLKLRGTSRGTQWSGPLFLGLRSRKTKQEGERTCWIIDPSFATKDFRAVSSAWMCCAAEGSRLDREGVKARCASARLVKSQEGLIKCCFRVEDRVPASDIEVVSRSGARAEPLHPA